MPSTPPLMSEGYERNFDARALKSVVNLTTSAEVKNRNGPSNLEGNLGNYL
jgi:hypothetical protein